jgi:hypothetical protein
VCPTTEEHQEVQTLERAVKSANETSRIVDLSSLLPKKIDLVVNESEKEMYDCDSVQIFELRYFGEFAKSLPNLQKVEDLFGEVNYEIFQSFEQFQFVNYRVTYKNYHEFHS